jgi:hypothetical protein
MSEASNFLLDHYDDPQNQKNQATVRPEKQDGIISIETKEGKELSKEEIDTIREEVTQMCQKIFRESNHVPTFKVIRKAGNTGVVVNDIQARSLSYVFDIIQSLKGKLGHSFEIKYETNTGADKQIRISSPEWQTHGPFESFNMLLGLREVIPGELISFGENGSGVTKIPSFGGKFGKEESAIWATQEQAIGALKQGYNGQEIQEEAA